jgi:hypothetical protein
MPVNVQLLLNSVGKKWRSDNTERILQKLILKIKAIFLDKTFAFTISSSISISSVIFNLFSSRETPQKFIIIWKEPQR